MKLSKKQRMKLQVPPGQSIEKGLTQSAIRDSLPETGNKKRGINIYSYSQIMSVGAVNQGGDRVLTTYDNPYFYLSPEDRLQIAQLSTPVQGVVTSRMHRIAGTKWVITNNKKEEDRLAEKYKSVYQVYKEYAKVKTDVTYIVARARLYAELKTSFPELLPDASNFENCLIRWHKKNQMINNDKNSAIELWLSEPNANDKWDDFIRKAIFDLHVHGTISIYKETMSGKVENLHILPGGTVIPVRQSHVSSVNAYLQLIDGFDPQIFFNDELSFIQYIPTSMRSYGLVPLEALINKVAEGMFFDKLMADQADGTKPPEKCIIVNTGSPFGGDGDLIVPTDMNEQKRLESKFNTPVKGAIMTLSGQTATVIDMSRENTMSAQMQRQKDIREDVALIFNMSNMEVNLTGSGDTSGRSTSETQQEIDQGKGITPILKLIQNRFNRDILPFRFGYGYSMEFQTTKNEREEVEIMAAKVQSGIYSVNEVRESKNLLPYDKPELDYPQGAGAAGQQQGQPGGLPGAPGSSAVNPMFQRSV